MNIVSEPEENYKSGWIKLFRSIKNHWIYPKNTPFTQFEAWLTILIEVNHSGEKVRIGNEFYECARGERNRLPELFHFARASICQRPLA